MSYRIVYGTDKQSGEGKPDLRFKKMIGMSVICLLLILGARMTGIGEQIWHWILPGDPAVTESAFASAWSHLENGYGTAEAITVFCQEILDSAQISESD